MYLIEKHHLERLRKAAKRLYSEKRMSGDDMRDMAQLIDAIIASAIPMADDPQSEALRRRPDQEPR